MAGLRLLARLAKLELKFRADQARVPKGQPGGGRFTDEHGGGGSRKPGFMAPLAAAAAARAATAAEAGVVAGAEGAAAAAAGVLGGAMLGLTSDSRPTPAGATGASKAPISLKAREACEADYDDDLTRCYNAFGLARKTYNPGHDGLRQCVESANDRFVDCLRRGGPGRSDLPLKLP